MIDWRLKKLPSILGSGGLGKGALSSGVVSYIEKVLGIETANLIGYWPMNESSGTTGDNAEGTASKDGTYNRDVSVMGTQIGIGDGNTAPVFNGTNDVLDVYSAALNTDWDGDTGSLSLWFYRTSWNDATLRFALTIQVDGSNVCYLRTTATEGQIEARYTAGGTGTIRSKSGLAGDTWHNIVITWGSGTANVYHNGVKEGGDWAIGTWVGNLVSTQTVMGGANNTPAFGFVGGLAHLAIWNTRLSEAQIQSLASP
jgi:hypothetical protein